MKFAEVHVVEGTESPTVRVVRRMITPKGGGPARPARKWTAIWCVGGRAKSKTLRTKSKAEAIREAFRLYEQLRAGKTPQPIKPVSIDQLCDMYLTVVENKGRTPATLAAYRNALGRFKEWAKHAGLITAGGLVEDDLWSFKRWLERAPQKSGKKKKKTGIAPRTVYFRCVLVKQLTKWAHRTNRLPTNPFVNASVEEPPFRPQPVFSREQVATLVHRAKEPWKTMWLLFALTGMRFGEIADLEWKSVLLDAGTSGIFVITKGGSGGHTTKNKKARSVPIHPTLRPMIQALPRHGARVFMSPPCTKRPHWGRLNERTVLEELKLQCAACGFENPRQFKLHSFRHTFVSQLSMRQGTAPYTLDFLGHADSKITRLYFSRHDAEAARQIASIDYSLSPTTTEQDKQSNGKPQAAAPPKEGVHP